MTHNNVLISASLFYYYFFLLVPKFRFIFENHMVLKKQIVNVRQAVPFLIIGRQFMSYHLLVLYRESNISASIEYRKTKK